ncbi:MAG: hypothetical protein M1840_004947 [Geoglossum simile]|nr:MAG: hypothetical protein M1840_004947 [Geoglossum simile]
MSPPPPLVELHDHCSVIYENTLYVYSPDAFQSLPLSEGAQWTILPMGVSAIGAVCVNAVSQADSSRAALYVVGGSTGSSADGYSGLQRYLFTEKRWETISPTVHVTSDRRSHGAVYLESSSSILIYAGTQDSDVQRASSQTFLISTLPPYSVTSYSSAGAPPLVSPTLLRWDESRAVLLGGNQENKRVFTFDPQSGWVDLGVTLNQGLPDTSQVQAVIVNRPDGNKILQAFNMDVSPNSVKRTCLQCSGNPPPQPTATSTPTSKRKLTALRVWRRQRDETMADWPPYNGTLAPKVTRTGYSIAQGLTGLVVVTGGNQEDPLCMFNSTGNQWINVTDFLVGNQAVVSVESVPTSSVSVSNSTRTPSPTSSPPSSESAAAVSGSGSSKARLPIILGSVLGAIAGVGIILASILFFLRWRRKKKAGHLRRSSGPGEKDRMSFADRGASFMREAGGFMSHSHHNSMNSQSSRAIITGGAFRGHKRGLFSKSNPSLGSGIFSKGPKNKSSLNVNVPGPGSNEKGVSFALTNTRAAHAPVAPIPRVPNSTDGSGKQRSSGWSRYFSGNPGMNLIHMNSGRSTYTEGSRSSDSHSQYSETRVTNQRLRESMTVPPLHYGRFSSGENLNNVPSASPTIRDSATEHRGTGLALTDGLSAEVRRNGSVSTVSSAGREDAFSSGIPASIHEPMPWSPVERDERATSSIYTDSARNTTIQRESTITMFPNPGPNVMVTDFDLPLEGSRNHSDMSWLNLGGSTRP